MLLSTNDKTIKLWRVSLEAEAHCILLSCTVCVVSQVSNHKQIIRLSALQVGDRKVCSLANFNFGDGSHNGWSIAAGYEPLPCSLVDTTQKYHAVLCVTAASYICDIAILGGTVRPSVRECRNTGANGSAARQKLATSTEHRLKSAENLRMPKVPIGMSHLSHTPAFCRPQSQALTRRAWTHGRAVKLVCPIHLLGLFAPCTGLSPSTQVDRAAVYIHTCCSSAPGVSPLTC